jgi:hypothetical protein
MQIRKLCSKTPSLLVCSLLLSITIFGQPEQGMIADNVIKLDLDASDRLREFYEGVAVIEKGTSIALIDTKGKIIVPFNKYTSLTRFVNGYSIAFDGKKSTLINKSGIEVLPGNLAPVHCADEYGYIEVSEKYGTSFFYNLKTGKRYPALNGGVTYQFSHFNTFYERLFHKKFVGELACVQVGNKFGFVSRTGEYIIKPDYDFADSFSDGLAVVGKRNEFGELKYGFIDTKEKLVIPLQFSVKPRSFYNNRAYVIPKDQSGFKFGYIDKTGTIKIKFHRNVADITYDFKDGAVIFIRDHQSNINKIVDTNGVEIPIPNENIFEGKQYKFYINLEVSDGQLRISSGMNHGLLNVKGEILVPPIFDELSHFDHVSKTARARRTLHDKKPLEGYINEKAKFFIIKSKESQW